jgi:ligand-binding sensor domain-containing protein/two-component sensor histidine kinase
MQRGALFLACFFICAAVHTQQYPFVYYTPKDGLINSHIQRINQDSKGQLYFATHGGLSIYDGARFTNYNRQSGLANDYVNDVFEAGPDSFLVSANANKLNTLVHGKIGVYETADHFYPIVNQFLRISDGRLYAASDEGLFILEDRKFKRLPFLWKGNDIGFCLERVIEWENYLLITTWVCATSVTMIVYDRLQQRVVDVLTHEFVIETAIDTKNRIWVSIPSGVKLLDTIYLKQGSIKFTDIPKEYLSAINPHETHFYFDREGNSWFFSGNLIQKFTPSLSQEMMATEQGLMGGFLTNFFEDREGTIWMTSEGTGVIKLKTTSIKRITFLLPGHPLEISGMVRNEDSAWFYNGADNAFYRVIKKNIKRIPLQSGTGLMSINLFGNNLYLTGKNKIFLVDQKDNPKAFLHPQLILNDSSTFCTGIIDPFGTIIQDRQIGNDYYLNIVKEKKIIKQYKIGPLSYYLAVDQKRHLWVASRDNHLMLFTIDPSDPYHYLQLVKDFINEVPRLSVRAIAIDRDNTIWIGTRSDGLYHYKLNGSKLELLKQFTTKEGLTENFVIAITCDGNNTWVGTQSGLDKVFMKDGKYVISNISKNTNIFQAVSKIIVLKDGTVWALNSDGSLLKIMAENRDTRPLPTIMLTSIKVNDQLLYVYPEKYTHTENNLSVSVAAPSYLDERSTLYSYYLEGSGNNHWSEPSNVATFNFLNLPPGNYILHMKADFSEALYPSQTTSYPFIILPAWWQTWWFRLGMVITCFGLITLLIMYYYKRKYALQKAELEKQQAIEKERTRIATDMHDDLGAGLSRIKFLSETIGIKKQQEQPIEEEISKIREYSHQMIDNMGEIVWALNERNDSLVDLLAYTRAYAVEYLTQNGINCKVDMPDQIPDTFLGGEIRRNIFLSVKEILHNIVKHAQATIVVIKIRVDKNLDFTIKDDGIGFNLSEIRPFSNGLTNIQNRMKEIGASSGIIVDSGTTVSLSVPISP